MRKTTFYAIMAVFILTSFTTAQFLTAENSVTRKIKDTKYQNHNLMTGVLNQIQEITSDDGSAGDEFGRSVAIEGDTAVVGAWTHSSSGAERGAVYIFIRNGVTWEQQAKLTASDEEDGDRFGSSVAISGDIVVVGSIIGNFNTQNFSGAAYVFTRTGNMWTEQAKLNANDATPGVDFGRSVAIDGETIIIGAALEDSVALNSGSAYVFVRNGTNWNQQAKLVADDLITQDQFGFSVSVSGETAVVGARFGNADGVTDSGSAYVFIRDGAVWSQQDKLAADVPEANDTFGVSVAIEGDTAVVGSQSDKALGSSDEIGSAYVFARSGTDWTEQQKLNSSEMELFAQFGSSVAIDGDTIAVGASTADAPGNNSGAGYIFKRDGNVWSEFRKLLVSNSSSLDLFGVSISVSDDTVIGGVPFRDVPAPLDINRKIANFAGADQGAANFFNLLGPTAANATISGKVVLPAGRGISRAIVHLTDQDGNTRTVTTNQFGYFRFEEIEVGQTLFINAFHKQFQFHSQIINFDDSITGLKITSQ